MPYLFDKEIDAVLSKDKDNPNLRHLKSECERITKELLKDHPRTPPNAYAAKDQTAADLAKSMGTKAPAKKGDHHAVQYVGNWRQVSDNYNTIYTKVAGELADAYAIGLDIRKPEVIGGMYFLATYIWSVLDLYVGPSDEQKSRR